MAASGPPPELTPEQNRRLRRIFDEALDLRETERRRFIEQACQDSPELLAAVWELIDTHGQAESFLEGRAHRVERIGRYIVTGELGRGGMGVVYDAIDPLIGRNVAVKVIHLRSLADSSQLALMRDGLFREAHAAGKLFHPGIVTILDVGQEGDVAFVTMERIEGPSLARILSEHERIGRSTALSILSQAATALDFAHQSGVTHRDVKPGNILIDKGTVVKITDFGIAKVTSSVLQTLAGMMVGTPSYMSPEQVEALPADGRSDQFSLAVVAYEILTGQRPFQGDSLSTLAHAVVYGKRPSAHAVNPNLAPAVDLVLERALAKDPADRFQTCAEFVGALDRAVSSKPSSTATGMKAMPAPKPERTTEAPSAKPGNRAFKKSALGATLLVAGAFAWFVHTPPRTPLPQARPAPKPAIAAFAASPASIQSGESTRLHWQVSNAPKIVVQPEVGDVSGRQEAAAAPKKPTQYSLTATGPGGSAIAVVFVDVSPAVEIVAPAQRVDCKPGAYKQVEGKPYDAVKLYTQCANSGEPLAMEALGEILLDGTGTAKNEVQAINWFRKAAGTGNVTAMLFLGDIYQEGTGTPQSYERALYWFSKAADAGSAAALFDLGALFENRHSGVYNIDKAREYYQKAANLGHEDAKKRLSQLNVGKTAKDP